MVLSEKDKQIIALQRQGIEETGTAFGMFTEEWRRAQAAIHDATVSDPCRPRTLKADVTSQGGLCRLPSHPPLIHLTKEHSSQLQREAIDQLNPITRQKDHPLSTPMRLTELRPVYSQEVNPQGYTLHHVIPTTRNNRHPLSSPEHPTELQHSRVQGVNLRVATIDCLHPTPHNKPAGRFRHPNDRTAWGLTQLQVIGSP